ncbi:MAG: hypothetical protein IK999_12605, partial [Ruminococcus sp.]|nr:hypothetical protein [Ruminococcus sp.]
GNVLKNLLHGEGKNEKYKADLSEQQRDLIEAAETMTDDLLQYSPSEKHKQNMKEIIDSEAILPILDEKMEQRRQEREQEHYSSYGMTR